MGAPPPTVPPPATRALQSPDAPLILTAMPTPPDEASELRARVLAAQRLDDATLRTNASGRLTEAQVALLRGGARRWGIIALAVVVPGLGIGALALLAGLVSGDATSARQDLWGALIWLLLAGLLALYTLRQRTTLQREAAEGRAVWFEGPARFYQGGKAHAWYLSVGSYEESIWDREALKDLIPQGSRCRIYQTPRTRTFLGLEHLGTP